ncbi:META domain-containing protein [Pseudodesulfovibrio sp.]|uniref:META domain-containing protein n=1 Tax=unclassified Pseudodesulfovibrio TaxID=2661612 RepID=UPI003B00E01A
MSRFRTLFCLSIFILLLSLAAGCGSKAPVEVNPDAVKNGIVGKKWFCKSIFERDVLGDQPLTIELKADGTVSGSGGCNTFTGTYTLEGDELKFGPLTSTEKACGGATGEQEFTYLSFLARVSRVEVDGDEMDFFVEGFLNSMHFSTSEGGFFLW